MSVEIDYMESYDTNEKAQAAYVSSDLGVLSNADIDDEDMADISDWGATDSGTGATTQVTFDSKSCMKCTSGATAGGVNYSYRTQDVGTFGVRVVLSVNLYCDLLGAVADTNYFEMSAYGGATRACFRFASDGLFINDGTSDVEVGTNLIVQDTWQEWTFDINYTAETVDVYLDGILKASDVDCSWASAAGSGLVVLMQRGKTITNALSYIDWFKAGSDVTSNPNFPNLQSYSEDTIKTQGSYSLKGIAVATDSLNDTLTKTVDPTIDLSNQDLIKMDIRASRTGSNIKIGFHDSGGTTTEHTANIASANEWQTENIDISGVANVNKDAIDSIIVTITNADAAGTFYLDNIYATIPALGNAIFFGANF